MASSRKSRPPNKALAQVTERFERALEAILARVVVSGTDAIAVAYSGGLDSAVLLHLAAVACQRRGRRLFALHVHHGLSPNANAWQAHCAAEAATLDIGFAAVRVDLDDVASLGTEQAARLVRYRALGELSRHHGVRVVLTAHHQDDQAETVLLQLFRGAGLQGLGGMGELQDSQGLLGQGVLLGRPLLDCARGELEQAAQALGIDHVVDESNADTRYRRNAVRHAILPAIERHFPGSAATVSRSSRHWQAAQRLLDDLAQIDEAQCAEGDALRIDRLKELSIERVDNLLRYWLAGQGAEQPPSAAQLVQLRGQVLSARPDAHPSLAMCGLVLQRHGGLLISCSFESGKPAEQALSIHWHGEPEIAVPEWHGALVFEVSPGLGLCPEQLRLGPVSLRPRSGGERLKPERQRPSRTLKNLYQEAGIPLLARRWLPLVYVGDALVYAAGLGMDARVADVEGGMRLGWRSC
jgi:tRNA(Ile)-lysidine synthase